jgi:hypothetical protein
MRPTRYEKVAMSGNPPAYDFYPLMYKFIRKRGKDMVPSDLRVAINDIEINLFDTEHVTDWPNLVPHEKNMLPNNQSPYRVNKSRRVPVSCMHVLVFFKCLSSTVMTLTSVKSGC